MNKFWVILSHTYLTKLKSKSFIIMTAIALLFVVGLVNIQSIVEFFVKDEVKEIAVIDDSNQFFEPLSTSVHSTDDRFKLIEFTGTEEEGKEAVKEDKYTGLLVLSVSSEKLPKATYYVNNMSGMGNQFTVEQHLQQLKMQLATQYSGIDEQTLMEINAPVPFQAVALDESAKTEEELNQVRGIVNIMLFILYFMVLTYGQMIMTDVANEKSSRVMELLVSSAPPVTHMFAKILGIALLGLTQLGTIILVGYVMMTAKNDELKGEIIDYLGLSEISPSIYVYAIVFFLLGYLLYATISAMLGSLVSRVEDTGQMMFPLVVLIMVAFFISVFGIAAPDSTFVTVTSYIPFFSPMIMFMRIGVLNIPTWEIGLSIGILIVTILLFSFISARVYKGGVLMYGRSSSLKDFKKALALSKKDS